MAYGSQFLARIGRVANRAKMAAGRSARSKTAGAGTKSIDDIADKKWIGDFSDDFSPKKILSKKRQELVKRLSQKTKGGSYAFKTPPPVEKGLWQSYRDLPLWEQLAIPAGLGLTGYGAYEAFRPRGAGGSDEGVMYVDEVPYQGSALDDHNTTPMGQQYVHQPQYGYMA